MIADALHRKPRADRRSPVGDGDENDSPVGLHQWDDSVDELVALRHFAFRKLQQAKVEVPAIGS